MSGQITPEDERKLVLATLLKSGSADGREDIRRYWRQRLDVLAAAPDLLAALKDFADFHEEGRRPSNDAMERAIAAIEKAEDR